MLKLTKLTVTGLNANVTTVSVSALQVRNPKLSVTEETVVSFYGGRTVGEQSRKTKQASGSQDNRSAADS